MKDGDYAAIYAGVEEAERMSSDHQPEPSYREAGAGSGVVCIHANASNLGAMARADGPSGGKVSRFRSRFV